MEPGDDSVLTGLKAIMEHDFRTFFKYRFFMAGLISMNLADLLIMAVVYTQMVSFNYFKFVAPGIVAVGLFAAAFVIGREVNNETRRGYNQYLLSLPVRRYRTHCRTHDSGRAQGANLCNPATCVGDVDPNVSIDSTTRADHICNVPARHGDFRLGNQLGGHVEEFRTVYNGSKPDLPAADFLQHSLLPDNGTSTTFQRCLNRLCGG